MHDVIVVGAGPVGLACAIEARRHGLSALVIEKGTLVNSIVGYPARMEFFSTPELIEIGGHPFPGAGLQTHAGGGDRVLPRRGGAGGISTSGCTNACSRSAATKPAFTVVTDKGQHAGPPRGCRHRLFRCAEPAGRARPGPSEGHALLPEPYRYVRQKVAIIGAKNSAAKAALDCYRHGAEVTLIVRAPALSDKIKYWIKPDLENRIKEGSIRAYFDTAVEAIRRDVNRAAHARRASRRSRTTGSWR